MINHNNSMYTTNPPSIIILEPATPKEELEWIIRNRLDEENIENGFEDIEAIRNRELIKERSFYGKTKRTKT